MKKVFKVMGIVLISFIILLVVFLFGIKIWNHIEYISLKTKKRRF